jgi:hypothetical protein
MSIHKQVFHTEFVDTLMIHSYFNTTFIITSSKGSLLNANLSKAKQFRVTAKFFNIL